jgi:hypothetical protein
VALLTAAGCGDGSSREGVELRPKPHELVDNLIIVERRQGNTGLLGLNSGRLLLEGRCILLEKDGTRATPVFGSSVAVFPHGLRVGGRELEWGGQITFPASGTPMQIEALEGRSCPVQGISVRGLR